MDKAGLRKVFDDLVRFETVLWNTVDARLRREHDFTLGGLNVLMVVEATAQCRVYDIAAALETFSIYHHRPAAVRGAGFITVRHVPLCFYYQNRTAHLRDPQKGAAVGGRS